MLKCLIIVLCWNIFGGKVEKEIECFLFFSFSQPVIPNYSIILKTAYQNFSLESVYGPYFLSLILLFT